MKTTWWIWHDTARSPYLNMAIDELLLLHSDQWQQPVIRLYDWEVSSASIGYVQNFTAAPASGYTVVRRPTGGGVVLHDNDLTYTVIVPATHHINTLDRVESYHLFHRAVKLALSELGRDTTLSDCKITAVDRATMQCFLSPTRYDVVADGIKFAGAAQRRTKHGILHQGSIKLSAANGNKSSLAEKLLNAFQKEFSVTLKNFNISNGFLKEAMELAANKYATSSWNVLKNG
jgi:lipoate-protein ligase A